MKRVFFHALQHANQSIFLSFYGITDSDFFPLLIEKSQANISISIEYDPSASNDLKTLLPLPITTTPIYSSGLMHRKIMIIDQAQVFLGTANLTNPSLRHHANLILGLYHPPLANFLLHPTTSSFSFDIQGQKGELYLLPDKDKTGFSRLLQTLESARKNIVIAMFTLTHPQIAQALIHAQKRGVAVSIAIDHFTAKGASQKTLLEMKRAGVKLLESQGKELFHHKWALIDEEILILGSANWTKAAFDKNHDFLLFLSPLTLKQKKFLSHLCQVIDTESVP